jgi:hypothetical protein
MTRLEERSDTAKPDLDAAQAGADGHEAISRAENPNYTIASDQALQVWMHRLDRGIAAEKANLEQALERSPSPPSRKNELKRAQAACRAAEIDCRAAQALVEIRRPEPLTGWQAWVARLQAPFGRTQARQDALLFADAERNLELARSRRASADAELQRITAEIATEKRTYEDLITEEDKVARPKQQKAERTIALYRDLRLVLEDKPWLAVQDNAALLSEVDRMRRARARDAWVRDEADTGGVETAWTHEAPIPRPG